MNYKELAAVQAIDYVKNGMVVGLGSGTTTAFFIRALAVSLQAGKLRNITAVSTSNATSQLASQLGISLTTLAACGELDLAVDGADEVDPDLGLIKGLGRSLLREKIVEIHAKQFIVIVDESKLVLRLGQHGPLPVEIVPFEWQATVLWLNGLGCQAELWHEDDGAPVVTDNGNYLARCWFPISNHVLGIDDPFQLASLLDRRPGIVEHGLFLGMADVVIVAGTGGIKTLERST